MIKALIYKSFERFHLHVHMYKKYIYIHNSKLRKERSLVALFRISEEHATAVAKVGRAVGAALSNANDIKSL